jgi:putative transposase
MPRRLRISTGGFAYHVLNRAAGRSQLFDHEADYLAMQRVIQRTHEQFPIRIVSYCLMPNHWHLVLWPKEDGELSEFLRLLTVTHTQRWHAHRHSAGTGPLYQGRFKSFPIQQDEHFLTVCRYVERNPLRANLVESARRWPWSSLAKRIEKQPPPWLLRTNQWPVDAPSDWNSWVNRAQTSKEVEAIRLCVKRGRPYGEPRWQTNTVRRLGLESTLHPRGRQRIHPIKTPDPFE